MKHNGLQITRDLEEVIDPETTALLVYDMQVGIFEQAPTLRPVIESVASVIEACRAAGVRIFFCRHTSLPLNLMGRSQLRTAMAWQRVDSPEQVRSLFLRDSPNTALVPEATALPTDAVFDKIGMSAFAGTPLDMALRDCGITSVAMVGVVLEIGIAPTVSHAEDLGYIPVVIEDACGSVDPDARERVLAGIAGTLMSLTTDVATFRRLI